MGWFPCKQCDFYSHTTMKSTVTVGRQLDQTVNIHLLRTFGFFAFVTLKLAAVNFQIPGII